MGRKLKGEFAIVLMKGRGKGQRVAAAQEKRRGSATRLGRGGIRAQRAHRPHAGRDRQGHAPRDARKSRVKKRSHSQKEVSQRAGIRQALRDRLPGAVRAPMPEAIVPMKALLTETPPKGDEWLFEIKWDGVRAICFIDDQVVRMSSRTGNSCERQYPELSVIGHQISARQAILDGEIAVLDKGGVSRFSLIQSRIAVADPNAIAHLARRTPATLFVFDLLYLDGYDLRGVPLVERKRALASILASSAGPALFGALQQQRRGNAGSGARRRASKAFSPRTLPARTSRSAAATG